jgi:hypothetical protein
VGGKSNEGKEENINNGIPTSIQSGRTKSRGKKDYSISIFKKS